MRISSTIVDVQSMLEAMNDKLKKDTPAADLKAASPDGISHQQDASGENPSSSKKDFGDWKSSQSQTNSRGVSQLSDQSIFKNPPPKSEMDYVNSNFDHQITDHHIRSTDRQGYQTKVGLYNPSFGNEYHPNEWFMRYNAKYPLFTRPTDVTDKIPYNATTVVHKQYQLISQANGFYGVLPSAIVRKGVVNQDTLLQTHGKQGEDLRLNFLNTPNGKHTQHIANMLGKEVTDVQMDDGILGANFRIALSDPIPESPPENQTPGMKRKRDYDDEDRRTLRTPPVNVILHKPVKHTQHIANMLGKEVTNVQTKNELCGVDFWTAPSDPKLGSPPENQTSGTKREREYDDEDRRNLRTPPVNVVLHRPWVLQE